MGSTVEPLNKDTFGILSFVERLSSFRGDFSIECVYMSNFGLSFVGRFVVFSECPLSEVITSKGRSGGGGR